MSGFAILCPGQGGQSASMFDLLPAPQQMELDAWWRQLPLEHGVAMPSRQALLQNPQHLFANRYAQVLVVAASLADWHALQMQWPQMPAPDVVAGYSVGELSACALAGMLEPAACLRLAGQRAQCMDACAIGHTFGMAALSVTGSGMQSLAALLATEPEVGLAIENGAQQWVVAGEAQAMQRLQMRALQAGASWQPLAVQIPSHTGWMSAAVGPFAQCLQEISWHQPKMAVVAGVSAQIDYDYQKICFNLQQQMAHTVRWSTCMDVLAETGLRVALELGPGTALTRMFNQRHPQIEVRAVSQFRSIQGVVDWLQRHL